MPFTPKLKADYIELINQSLDTILVDTMEDFAVVQQALENMLEVNPEYQVTEKYKEKMISINCYLNEPEDYVQHESDYAEYQQIIKERIASKINELGSLNTEQKQTYIQVQSAAKAQVAANQQAMSHHTPPLPGAEAHVISDEEHHAELQRRFNLNPAWAQEDSNPQRHFNPPVFAQEVPRTLESLGVNFTTSRFNPNPVRAQEEPNSLGLNFAIHRAAPPSATQNIFARLYQAMVSMFSFSDTTQSPARHLPDLNAMRMLNETRVGDLVRPTSTVTMLGELTRNMPEDERLADLESMRAPDLQSSTPPTASANNQHQSQPDNNNEETKNDESQTPRLG